MIDTSGRVHAADKRIFGSTSDVNQLVPFRYGWAWDAYLEANKNHWMVEHAHLSIDLKGKADYSEVLPKNVLDGVMAYITTRSTVAYHLLDVLQDLYSLTTAPECRQYMLRQMEELSVWVELPRNLKAYFPEDPGYDTFIRQEFNRVVQSITDNFRLCLNAGGGTLSGFSQALYLMVERCGLHNTNLETWLLKEIELPTELRKIISWVQRDSILMRRFYVNMLNTLVDENPVLRNSITAGSQYVAYAFTSRDIERDIAMFTANEIGNARSQQFARHVLNSTFQSLGHDCPQVASPYAVKAIAEKATPSNDTLSWD